ncbi:MAG: hypothetical protein JRI47_02685, partial [Deltaproteobacteria bacterium]|nr:hypothetical protein [Deltaproteobacteria bacterium]
MKNPPDKGVCIRRSLPAASRTSDALRVNLEATDQAFTIDAKYLPLAEVVEDYPGLLHQAEAFMCELNHPLKNWRYVVREMRRYALQNFSVYFGHPGGLQVVKIILYEWFDALSLSSDKSVQVSALENIVTYCEKMVGEAKDRAGDYGPLFSEVCERLINLPDEQFFLLASCYYPLRRIGQIVVESGSHGFESEVFNQLYGKTLLISYHYWLDQEDPESWTGEPRIFDGDQEPGLFQTISHGRLVGFIEQLDRIEQNGDWNEELSQLLALPDFADIVKAYEQLPDRIEELEPDPHEGAVKKLLSLLRILETRGLVSIHEALVARVNRCLTSIIRERKAREIEHLLVKTFETMGKTLDAFPETALHALENMGSAIFKAHNSALVEHFIEHTIDLGFQCPDIKGTTSEWKVRVNRVHVPYIKTWLHLIENHPKWSTKLVSALIVNLRLSGLYVRDTDLFQKEVSRFLNSDIGPVYHLAKQLAKLFPVYFNEINAEGRIRDISTEMDELFNRKDVLIHFFRKQCHVESNNLLLDFCLKIIDFWRTRDKGPLSPYVAPEVLEAVKQSGPYVDGPHEVIRELFLKMGVDDPHLLLDLNATEIDKHFSRLSTENEPHKARVGLMIAFLRLLNRKYNLNASRLEDLIKEARVNGLPRTDDLEKALQNDDPFDRLQALVNYLKRLKEIILSPEAFKASEDIYRKRHIAAGIPSMYGTYRERKFDALGLSFRLENVANVRFEALIASIDLDRLTGTTMSKIADCMHLLVQAMELDGIGVRPLREYLYFLTHAVEVSPFSMKQYLDIFRGVAEAEQQVLNTHFTIMHRENLARITRQLSPAKLLPKYLVGAGETDEALVINKVSEVFFRDVVTATFGFQYLDSFVSKVIDALSRQSEAGAEQEPNVPHTYDGESISSSIYSPSHPIKDPIYLGGKGYNLVRLADFGMPVPSGFIVTTEVFRCPDLLPKLFQGGEDPKNKIVSRLQALEAETKKELGHPDTPLLLSVRSGAAISLPGMMNTFLNVGMNDAVVRGVIAETGNPWFAWDNYGRFLRSWGMCHGMERKTFDAVMDEHTVRCRVRRKRELAAEQMQDVTRAYRDVLAGAGLMPPDDSREQLFQAIRQAFRSWNSGR